MTCVALLEMMRFTGICTSAHKVFDLEMEHLWPSSWIYLGHDSQVPEPGDYLSVDVAREPLIMVRDRDGSVCVR